MIGEPVAGPCVQAQHGITLRTYFAVSGADAGPHGFSQHRSTH